jgi:hypothetical protein
MRQSTLKTKFASSFISRTRKFVREGLKGKHNYIGNRNVVYSRIITLKIPCEEKKVKLIYYKIYK